MKIGVVGTMYILHRSACRRNALIMKNEKNAAWWILAFSSLEKRFLNQAR